MASLTIKYSAKASITENPLYQMINFMILGIVLKIIPSVLHLMQIDAYIAFGCSIQPEHEPK